MKMLMSAIALTLVMTVPVAATESESLESNNSWYIQGSWGEIIHSDAEEQALQDLSNLGHNVTSVNFRNSNDSLQLELGYKFTDNWAVTAGYIDLGDTTFNVEIETLSPENLADDIANVAPRYGSGPTLGIVYSYRFFDDFVFSVDSGAVFLKSTFGASVNLGTEDEPDIHEETFEDNAVQWYASSGLSYYIYNLELGVYYRHYEINSVGSGWLGARMGYHF